MFHAGLSDEPFRGEADEEPRRRKLALWALKRNKWKGEFRGFTN